MGWNVQYAQSISKAEWMEQHKDRSDEFDLSAEYDKMVPPKTKRKEVEKVPDDKKEVE